MIKKVVCKVCARGQAADGGSNVLPQQSAAGCTDSGQLWGRGVLMLTLGFGNGGLMDPTLS